MKQTKIDWCDCTVNPVVGCAKGCEYCYARKLNSRFKFIKDWDKPQFFPERLEQFKSKKPKSIFINSMSDIAWWKKDWWDKVISAINDNPQHNYIALSKTLYIQKRPKNLYLGVSIDTQDRADKSFNQLFDFFSIEPILEPIYFPLDYLRNSNLKLIIIGAETGNRKGKVIPEKKWIDNIVKQADRVGISVFMKESLKDIMGEDFRQDKLIWAVNE